MDFDDEQIAWKKREARRQLREGLSHSTRRSLCGG